MESGLGNRCRTHHHPINQATGDTNSDLLEDKEKDLIQDMVGGQAQDAQIQNIVFNKTGKLITRYTIRQITKYKKRMIVNDSDFSDMFGENLN